MPRFVRIAEFLLGFLVVPAILALLNYFLIWPNFAGEITQHIGSIEISYIQMAKFLVENFPHILWQPFWYLGFPMHVFYTPLLPFLEVVLKLIANVNYGQAYRILTSSAYILVPVSVYFFVWGLTSRKIGGMVAALAYSFLPSIIAVIFSEVKQDFLATVFEPRRYTILVRWGEGPHIFALVFVPLAALFYHRSIQTERLREIVSASIFLTLTALSNPIGLWVAGLLFLAIFLGSITKTGAGKMLSISAKVGLVTAGLSAFWYNPSFIGSFFREGGGALNTWLSLFPWGVLAILGIGVVIYLVTRKIFAKVEGFGATAWFFVFTFLIVFTYYYSGEARLELVPQALRLNTEVDLAVSIFLGVTASFLFGLFWESEKFPWLKFVAPVLPGILIVAILSRFPILAARLPEHTKNLELTGRSLTNIAEFRVAKKLEEFVGDGNTRVVAPGNYGFWLNYFTNIPQLRGALFQSSIHHWPEHIYYQITNGSDTQISLAWLKIANVSHLVYTTGASAEIYKDYKVKPEKFDSILQRIEDDRGDIYFQVPLKNPSLAKLVDLARVKSLKKPFNAIDEEPIFNYLAWIEEDSGNLEVKKINNDKWQISGFVSQGKGILVQMSYHSGWKARTVNSQQKTVNRLKIAKDPLGFMIIKPKKAGDQVILLEYGTIWQVWQGWMITAVTIVFLIWRFLKRKTENVERKT